MVCMGWISLMLTLVWPLSAYCALYNPLDLKFIENHQNQKYREYSRSVAALIPVENYYYDQVRGQYYLKRYTLSLEQGVCSDERFAQELVAPVCTGFLITNRLLVTAGHCIPSTCEQAAGNIWFFGYTRSFLSRSMNANGLAEISAERVFKCAKVLEHHYINNAFLDIEQNDYALVLLNREVNLPPLDIRTSGKIERHTPLMSIGHPSGMAKMISGGARVQYSQNKNYFLADLDAIKGISGAPVFNSLTEKVEGFVVRSGTGKSAYYTDPTSGCRRMKVGNYYYGGTEISRINAIPNLIGWMDNPFGDVVLSTSASNK